MRLFSVFVDILLLIVVSSEVFCQIVDNNKPPDSFAFPDELVFSERPAKQELFRIPDEHFHHDHGHHHHDYEFHRKNGGQFEGGREEDASAPANSSMQIPLDFIKNLNKYNVSDLLLHFVDDFEESTFVQDRFGDKDGQERSRAVMPKAAICLPELKTVQLAESNDPSIVFIPACTRVERCGGCCTNNLLKCQPTETETITYKVLKTQYTGGPRLKMVSKDLIAVERHIKCACDCRVKAEDCNKFQVYKPAECSCGCTNKDEEKKCSKNREMFWNPDLCACQCKRALQCATGQHFDPVECRCALGRAPVKNRKFSDFEGQGVFL